MSKANTESDVDYGAMDPFKIVGQAEGRRTDANIEDTGMRVVEWSRGESVFLIERDDCFLALVVEQLGTKNLVADEMYELTGKSHYREVAIDTVGTIANDLVVSGARAIVTGQMPIAGHSKWFTTEKAADFLRGWKEGCDTARCVYGPGESPTLTTMVSPETAVLTGAAVGIIEPKERLITRDVQEGAQIIFIESNGIHANGISSARRLAARLPEGYLTPVPGTDLSFGEALLKPSHIYAGLVDDALNGGVKIHSAIHMTGHGIPKLMRSPEPWRYVLTELSPVPPELQFLARHQAEDDRDAYETWNMGTGFAFITPEESVERLLALAVHHGFRGHRAGYVEKSGRREVVVEPLGLVYDELSVN